MPEHTVESTGQYDAIVLGAGAAGLLCAIEAGKRGRRVLLVEHNDTVGKKIRISGGGRCNFTNVHAEPSRYISDNPRFAQSAMARYTPEDFIALVEQHGIAYHEKKLGQLFCDESAQQIIDALLKECAEAHVDIRTSCRVLGITKNDAFLVHTSLGEFAAPALVVATGGRSIPKLGATDFGYHLAEQFGVPTISDTPGLVPMTLPHDLLHNLADLSGISFDAVASVGKTKFEEAVLITHRGLSGPAILQVSSYWKPGLPITLNLFPESKLENELLTPQAHPTADNTACISFETRLQAIRKSPLRSQQLEASTRRSIGCQRAFHGAPTPTMGAARRRYGRLRQGRSDLRRRRHASTLPKNHGSPRRSRFVFYRRNSRHDRMARWLQFPMGLGIRRRRGQGAVAKPRTRESSLLIGMLGSRRRNLGEAAHMKTSTKLASPLYAALLAIASLTSYADTITPAPEGSFSFVVIPDTQNYMGNVTKAQAGSDDEMSNPVFEAHTQWIADNIETQRIAFVSHVGDIVDKNVDAHWKVARRHMDQLHGRVPYGIVVGNHDMTSDGDSSLFQSYFPAERFKDFEWYGGHFQGDPERNGHSGNNANSYQFFSAEGLEFVVIHLECNAPDNVVEWANNLLAQHKDRWAIISTHMDLGPLEKPKEAKGYTDDPKGRMRWKKCHGERGNTPAQLWDKLYRKHPHLLMVCSGDQRRTSSLRLDATGDHGKHGA